MNIRNSAKIIAFLASLMLLVVMVACDFDESKNNFNGGEILNDRIMESIQDSFDSETTDESNTVAVDEGNTSSNESDTATDESNTETNDKTEDQATEEIENSSENVYWLETGSVWHIDRQCRHIKDKSFVSGTVEEAIAAGKDHLCKSCGK